MAKGNTTTVLSMVLVLLLALAISRAFFLTVFMGGHFSDLAKDNMVTEIYK